MDIIQIVPNLPPSIGGVADYSYLLAQQLRKAHGVQTTFVVCNTKCEDGESGKRKAEIDLDGFKVYQLRERSAAELLQVLSQPGMPQTVLLQYVGYGYEKRGCPAWLARGLEKWRKQNLISNVSVSAFGFSARPRLITMFHELYASGPPWRSSFWTSPVQRWIAKSLACLSGHCFTNLRRNVPVLQRMSFHPEQNFTVLPVFSTVGEPEKLQDWNERQRRMIVFGSAPQRQKVYFECKSDLEEACHAMGLDEIVDVGAPFEIPPLAVRVLQRGILLASEVSREMLNAQAGFFAYPTAYLGKSTIFAAYAAHGLVPVTFTANTSENEDGLCLGEQFLTADNLNSGSAAQPERVSAKARDWYAKHEIHEHTKDFGKIVLAGC